MRIASIKVFSIGDLDGPAYEQAIANVSIMLGQDFDGEYIKDMFTEWCKIIGIYRLQWGWSGFCSQGDGAHFTGRYYYETGWRKKLLDVAGPFKTRDEFLEIAERLQDVQRRNFYSIYSDVKHRGHYQHELCTRIDVWSERIRDLADEDESEVVECFRDIMRLFYQTLEGEYEWTTSEEAALEWIKDNDIEFYESGEIY